MKKVVALVGSARNGQTLDATRELARALEAYGDVECEVVRLSDYRIEACRGCKACFLKGEAACPLADDRDALIAKLDAADGVVLASPNYMFQVSGFMKVFLDRLGFLAHRPRMHGKALTAVVVQGMGKGGAIRRYLEWAGMCLGFDVVRGSVSTAFDPMTAAERRTRSARLAAQAKRFHRELVREGYRVPGLMALFGFRLGRTSIRLELDDACEDFRYYRDRDWFSADYFYPTRLGPVKRVAGALFDLIAARTFTQGAARRAEAAASR